MKRMAKEINRFFNKVLITKAKGLPISIKTYKDIDDLFEGLIPISKRRVEEMYEGEELHLEIANSFQLYQATYDGEWVEHTNP